MDAESLKSDRTELRRVTVAVAVVLALTVALAAALLGYTVVAIDRLRAEREAEQVQLALKRTGERLVEDATSVTIWDDTYRHFGERIDWAWAQINFGDYFADYMKHDVTLAFDRAGRYVYASRDSERSALPAEQAVADAGRSLVDAVRAEAARKRRAPDGSRRFGFAAVATRTGVVRVGDEAYVMVAASVVTETAEAIDSEAPDAVILTGRSLRATAETIAADLAIEGLRAAAPGATARVALRDPAGRSVGGLDWTPARPGAGVVLRAAPFVLAALALLTAAAWLLLRRVLTVNGRLQKRHAELAAAARELTRARDAAEAAAQAKSRFLANMSHELRTPLNGVIALGQLLHDRHTAAADREMAGLIVTSGRVLEQVVDDILDSAKIESGALRLETRPFRLREVLGAAAELHGAAAAAKGVGLRWSTAADLEPEWLGDPVRISQILSNLLSNAVKFTEAGEVRVRALLGRRGLVLSVRDTGLGFDGAAAERLFRPFEQADDTTTRRFGGTGLGLTICRSLAELMGGRIRARSVPGRGSVFRVELALAPARVQTPPIQTTNVAEPAMSGTAAATRPLRVLLAEDHPTNQKVVALVLETAGVELAIVETGSAALDAWRDGAFDVILMDVQMPEMDGLTATRLIRERERAEGRPRTPVISLTAHALDEHRDASEASGADLHLSKPIRPDALLAALAAVTSEPGSAPVVARRSA